MDEIRLEVVNENSRPLIENLWQFYSHDLSIHRGSLPEPDGRFRLGRLPSIFEDPNRTGFLIFKGHQVAGFAIVGGATSYSRMIVEFFVLAAFRNKGIGSATALKLIGKYPGDWEIPFQNENVNAARFWRGIAEEVSPGAWSEETRPVPQKPEVPPDAWISFTTH